MHAYSIRRNVLMRCCVFPCVYQQTPRAGPAGNETTKYRLRVQSGPAVLGRMASIGSSLTLTVILAAVLTADAQGMAKLVIV